MKKFFLSIAAVLCLAVGAHAQNQKGSGLPQKPEVRIACIGDSITWGAGLEDRFSQSYPVVLGKMLGSGYKVRNFGYNSRTASRGGDYPYLEAAKYDTLKMWLPDVVTIMLGTNDSKPQNWDAQKYYDGLMEMVMDLRKIPSHPKIFAVTPTPAGTNVHAISDSVIFNGVIPELRKVAKKRWLHVIDTYTPMEAHRDCFPDGVHPNVEGSRLIAEIVYGQLSHRGIAPGQRILFMGDSITDGFWGRKDSSPSLDRDHYDQNHVYGHGYQAICIADLMLQHPESHLRCYNRGKGGDTLKGIRARWNTDVEAIRPTLISMLVGINDTGDQNLDAKEWEKSYRALIDSTLKTMPGVQFVLCTPFYAEKGHKVEELAAAVRRIAADYDFVLVDFAAVMDELARTDVSGDESYWLWDRIHPTYAAHMAFAKAWLAAVRARYPEL